VGWGALMPMGVAVMSQVHALFRTYGHDSLGYLPYDVFCRRLFSGRAKMAAIGGCQQGAYNAAEKSQWKHAGMIKYPPPPHQRGVRSVARVVGRAPRACVRARLRGLAGCVWGGRYRYLKKAVMPPSDWGPAMAEAVVSAGRRPLLLLLSRRACKSLGTVTQ
jgi:hypothetical protein